MESLGACLCIPGVEVAYVCRADAAADVGAGGGAGIIASLVSRLPSVGGGGDLYLDNVNSRYTGLSTVVVISSQR